MRRKGTFDLEGYIEGAIQLTDDLSFVPTGSADWGGLEGELDSKPTMATIFLGLVTGADVKPRQRFTVGQVVAEAKRLLRDVGLPGASVVSQVGIFKQRGEMQDEPSVQIVILETDGLSWEKFRLRTLEMADLLRLKFQQDQVFVAYVKEGEMQKTWVLP